jgi:carbamoyltransferase
MTLILGVNAFHANSSACLLKNGEIIFAIEEERINRIKNWAGFPKLSIQMCLDYGNININEIDFIGINKNFKANIKEKIFFSFSNIENFNYALKKYKNIKAVRSLKETIIKEFKLSNLKPKIVNVDHHVAHMASSCLTNSFKESALLSLDGFGDFASCSIGAFSNNNINITNKVFYPHSLGILYQSITQLLGFKNYGDEYKIMGMSALGNNKFEKKFENIISIKDWNYKLNKNYFSYFNRGLNFNFLNTKPIFPKLYSHKMLELFGLNKKNIYQQELKADIACSLQVTFEKTLFSILKYIEKNFNTKNLSYAGGCAMNSLANGKILQNTKFTNLSIHSASYDAGGAIGAAAYVHFKYHREKIVIKSNYLGPEYNNNEIKKIIKNELTENFKIKFLKSDKTIIEFIVKKIIQKKIIALFRGRLEWGARALGNRSILADPRGTKIKDIINKKIKLRENFRPFAPSILFEHAKKWFVFSKIKEVSSMMQVLQFKKDVKFITPAIRHADNTGRLQTVKKKDNKFYYKLLSRFYKKTKVPILLNTSFNVDEPIVCSPVDAINCFKKSKIDFLVIENFIISKKNDSFYK